MAAPRNLHALKRYPRFAPGFVAVLTKEAVKAGLGARNGSVMGEVLRVDPPLGITVRMYGTKTPRHFHVGYFRHWRPSDQTSAQEDGR